MSNARRTLMVPALRNSAGMTVVCIDARLLDLRNGDRFSSPRFAHRSIPVVT